MKRKKDYPPIKKGIGNGKWHMIIQRHNSKAHAWGGLKSRGELLALCGRLLPPYAETNNATEVECNDCQRYLYNRIFF